MADEEHAAFIARVDQHAALLADHYRADHDLDLDDPTTRKIVQSLLACPLGAMVATADAADEVVRYGLLSSWFVSACTAVGGHDAVLG